MGQARNQLSIALSMDAYDYAMSMRLKGDFGGPEEEDLMATIYGWVMVAGLSAICLGLQLLALGLLAHPPVGSLRFVAMLSIWHQ